MHGIEMINVSYTLIIKQLLTVACILAAIKSRLMQTMSLVYFHEHENQIKKATYIWGL